MDIQKQDGEEEKEVTTNNKNIHGHAHVKRQSEDLIETHHSVLPKRSKKKRHRRIPSSGANEGREAEVEDKNGHGVQQSLGGGRVMCDAESMARADVEALVSSKGTYVSDGTSFEYLDHTADVQLHAWGDSLKEAFEQVALCMFNYMTPLHGIVNGLLEKNRSGEDDASPSRVSVVEREFVMTGNDAESLMFHWLDELLFTFSTDFFVPVVLEIIEFDVESWRIRARGKGDVFDPARHACGTEIKAITYSAMKIYETSPVKTGKAEVYVIVDI
jgi:SHS2 domain-containing protein